MRWMDDITYSLPHMMYMAGSWSRNSSSVEEVYIRVSDSPVYSPGAIRLNRESDREDVFVPLRLYIITNS